MKKSLYVLIFILAGMFSFAQQAKPSNSKVAVRTNIYCDHCKECPSCGKRLQSGLLKIKGVKMYELDDKKQIVTVYFNPGKTDETQIRKAISELGYDADEVKANPIAYEKLDDCCKKG